LIETYKHQEIDDLTAWVRVTQHGQSIEFSRPKPRYKTSVTDLHTSYFAVDGAQAGKESVFPLSLGSIFGVMRNLFTGGFDESLPIMQFGAGMSPRSR